MASSRHSSSSTTLGVLLLHLIIAIITDTTTTMIDGVYSTSTNAATATSSLSFLSGKRLFGGMKRRPPLRLRDDEYTTAHHADAATTNNDEYNDHHHLHGVVIEERPKQEEEEEYITNFYTRVRAKRRAMLNQDDTSSLPSSTSSSELSQYGSSSSTIDEEKECDTTHNTAARSIRGGSSFWRNTRHQDTLADADYYEVDSDDDEEEEDEMVHHPLHHHHQQQQHDHFLNHHCNGLLRVPCSIVINSESSIETTSSLLDSPPSPAAVTAVSAYVDTGATVTVISAAAAKRAGIYHLMDSRYAGRATGVGHCRVLGRIPAHHVSFLLGGSVEKEIDYRVRKNPRSVRGGGLNHCQSIDKKKCRRSSNNSNGLVQMDGPALTVIEGTVTKGVDVLLGLDVLQDWEAVIRMSGPIQTITVREKTKSTRFNGDEISNTVVIPFATPTTYDGSSRRTSGHGMNRYSGGVYIARDNNELLTHDHRLRYSNNDNNNGIEYDSDDNDDPYFSPTSTDIESDLDLLDKLGHEFPHQHVRTNPINNKLRNKVDDDIVNDDRDYYLHDDDDDEEKIDMSGL